MPSLERRREIATFLRARRARLQPHEVGLPAGGRRRVEGLRREEVATLAGVSTEWYTWIEQARDVRPSAEVLRRIGSALRLEPGEARHLLALADYAAPVREGPDSDVPELGAHLQRILDQLDPYPAWVYGERWDVVAWNRGATVLYGNFAAMEGLERNMLCILFLDAGVRRMLVDWPRVARGLVAKVRAIYARYVDDPWYHEVVDRLCVESAEFAAWWRDHEVQPHEDGAKAFDHPRGGRLSFDYSVLDLRDERFPNLSLVTYAPQPGTGTLEAMERLLAAPPASLPVLREPRPRVDLDDASRLWEIE
jgi:transcriptional regulator with XRE-family HTH domain